MLQLSHGDQWKVEKIERIVHVIWRLSATLALESRTVHLDRTALYSLILLPYTVSNC